MGSIMSVNAVDQSVFRLLTRSTLAAIITAARVNVLQPPPPRADLRVCVLRSCPSRYIAVYKAISRIFNRQ